MACGLPWLARRRLIGQGCVLTFHGLRTDEDSAEALDESLHLPLSVFRQICAHLKARYEVLPLIEMVRLLKAGKTLPAKALAITFDDGLKSNYQLGFPVLKEFGLPATIFLTTGFLDGLHRLWFQELDRAFKARGAASAELSQMLKECKMLPDAEMRARVQALTAGCDSSQPELALPMTWDHVAEMRRSGLIDFGGHTHTHPILSRCSLDQQSQEIRMCRDRLQEQLGEAPPLFAYTNGSADDFTADTQRLLAEHGFEAAFTMIPGRLCPGQNWFGLPRYGNPTSVLEAEATASGAFELLKHWRGGVA